MIEETATKLGLLLAALGVGFFGSTHCFAMCGGIAAALGQATETEQSPRSRRFFLQLLYSVGRIASYAAAGALAGALGFLLADTLGPRGPFLLRMVAGAFLVALGLYLAGWWLGLRHIEVLGARLWRKLSPLVGKLLPVDSPGKALLVGGLWGWLPCGLVYSALATAASAGGGLWGALCMLSFGLGTIPAILATGSLAEAAGRLLRRREVRWLLGVSILLFGLWTIWGATLAMQEHCH